MNATARLLAPALLAALGASPLATRAQTPTCTPEHAAMGHCTPKPAKPVTSACSPEHAAMGHCAPTATASMPAASDRSGMAMPGMSAATLPRTPIPVLTDADRAAAFPPLVHASMDHGEAIHHYLLLDRLETREADPGSAQAWEASVWIGGDIDRLWLRSEGERVRGRLDSADVEALYGRAISPWWDLLAGLRHDAGPGDVPSRQWIALGVQGLAPYKFEVSATAYLGRAGHSAIKAGADYDVLLSNRLILQPRIEATWYGRADPGTRSGAGLSSVTAGLRLRYEIVRRFAPYIGIEHERRFGDSTDFARADGDAARETRWVAGLRIWF